MSLILDALKKSEAERNRGLPPNLYAHYRTPKPTRQTPWVAGAGAVLLVAGLSGGWFMLARGRTDVVPAVPPNTLAQVGQPGAEVLSGAVPVNDVPQLDNGAVNLAQVSVVSNETRSLGGLSGNGSGSSITGGGLPVPKRAGLFTPTLTPAQPTLVATPPVATKPPAAAAPQAKPPQSVAAQPVAVTPQAPPPVVVEPVKVEPVVAAAPAPVAVEPVPVAAAPASVAVEPTPVAVTPPPVAAAPPAAPAPVAQAIAVVPEPAQKPEEVLPMVFQLPYATRKDLPKLEMSMHVYSPIRSERFVVLNGKRLTLDMPPPGPELALLEIVSDGAVFEFRGQRFVLPRQTY